VARGANRSAHGSGWLLNAAAGVRFAPSGLTRGRLPKPRRGRPDRRVDEGLLKEMADMLLPNE